MKNKAKVRNKKVIVSAFINGDLFTTFKVQTDDAIFGTPEAISSYINTQIGCDETRELTDETLKFIGYKIVEMLIHYGDKGDFLRRILDTAIERASTVEQRENAIRLKKFTLPLLGRVYYDVTNNILSLKEKRRYCGFDTYEAVLNAVLPNVMIMDGILTFRAEIER